MANAAMHAMIMTKNFEVRKSPHLDLSNLQQKASRMSGWSGQSGSNSNEWSAVIAICVCVVCVRLIVAFDHINIVLLVVRDGFDGLGFAFEIVLLLLFGCCCVCFHLFEFVGVLPR